MKKPEEKIEHGVNITRLINILDVETQNAKSDGIGAYSAMYGKKQIYINPYGTVFVSLSDMLYDPDNKPTGIPCRCDAEAISMLANKQRKILDAYDQKGCLERPDTDKLIAYIDAWKKIGEPCPNRGVYCFEDNITKMPIEPLLRWLLAFPEAYIHSMKNKIAKGLDGICLHDGYGNYAIIAGTNRGDDIATDLDNLPEGEDN